MLFGFLGAPKSTKLTRVDIVCVELEFLSFMEFLSFKLRVPKCQPSSSRVILLKTKDGGSWQTFLLQQILHKL
jgi:hypothetical protein